MISSLIHTLSSITFMEDDADVETENEPSEKSSTSSANLLKPIGPIFRHRSAPAASSEDVIITLISKHFEWFWNKIPTKCDTMLSLIDFLGRKSISRASAFVGAKNARAGDVGGRFGKLRSFRADDWGRTAKTSAIGTNPFQVEKGEKSIFKLPLSLGLRNFFCLREFRRSVVAKIRQRVGKRRSVAQKRLQSIEPIQLRLPNYHQPKSQVLIILIAMNIR